jgi:RNA ligase (TIGR02306 family)
MRQLATIQTITDIQPIPDADAIEVASVLGWKVVIKKGEFNIGDRIVYCEVDSIIPERPEFEFLRPVKFRVKTRRMRGQISQGIVFPLSVLETTTNPPDTYEGLIAAMVDGLDVTDFLGVVKYDIPEEDTGITVNGQGGRSAMKRGFPNWIPKTDETRIQSVPKVLEDAVGTAIYITEKLDGSSYTCFLKDDEFGVCSRNQEKKENDSCHFWEVSRKFSVREKMEAFYEAHKDEFPEGLAIQGELAGPGVQQNKLKLPERTLFVFNIYNIATRTFCNFKELVDYSAEMGLTTVPILNVQFVLNHTVHELVELATRKSAIYPGAEAEGIVIRPLVESSHRKLGRFSFKVINPKFLLKYDL